MKDYNLILISTHQNSLHVLTLINSIHNNIKNIKVLLLIVSQECEINYESQNPLLVITFIDEVKMGLSKARNIALKHLSQNTISAEYIMFPDDDSSFDQDFFINFSTILNSNKCFITPIYNEGTKDLYLGKLLKYNCFINENMHSLIGSPNQIILYEKFKEQIFFNEDLGVGSKYGSCEDYDLFIRLNRFGAKYFFISTIYSFHPSKLTKNIVPLNEIVKRYKSYSPGFVFIIKKYSKYRFMPSFLVRPLVGSIFKVLMFDFKMASVYCQVFFFRIKLLYDLL